MRQTSAIDPSLIASTTSIRHSGWARSSRSAMRPATISRSRSGPTGPGSWTARTWRAISNASSSTQSEQPAVSGERTSRRRNLGAASSRPSTCARNSPSVGSGRPSPGLRTTTLQAWPRMLPASRSRIRTSSALRRSSRMTDLLRRRQRDATPGAVRHGRNCHIATSLRRHDRWPCALSRPGGSSPFRICESAGRATAA